jgi:hypothetical protein
MSVENIIEGWREVRNGLIDEANQIPRNSLAFNPLRYRSVTTASATPRRIAEVSCSAKLAGRIPT